MNYTGLTLHKGLQAVNLGDGPSIRGVRIFAMPMAQKALMVAKHYDCQKQCDVGCSGIGYTCVF